MSCTGVQGAGSFEHLQIGRPSDRRLAVVTAPNQLFHFADNVALSPHRAATNQDAAEPICRKLAYTGTTTRISRTGASLYVLKISTEVVVCHNMILVLQLAGRVNSSNPWKILWFRSYGNIGIMLRHLRQ